MSRFLAKNTVYAAAIWGWLLGSSGCSPQATTDYQGDPLFSMTGRVELALTDASGDPVIPAVAFMTPDQDVIRFVDAEVRGEFPAEFSIDLYAPPPAESIDGFTWEELPEEPRYTVGFISAVKEEHLSTLYFASSLGGNEDHCDEMYCYQTFVANDFDGTHTGKVIVRCPNPLPEQSPDVPPGFDLCEVTAREGDPMFISFMRDPMFAGAVTNYALAYLQSDAPANGVVAHMFGAPDGLSAGYHLMHWENDLSDELAKQPCRDMAAEIAVDRYNQAHGTNVTSSDRIVSHCPSAGCPMSGPHTRGLRGEWYRVMSEMGCLPGYDFAPVADPGAEPISLQMEPGLSFTLAASGGI